MKKRNYKRRLSDSYQFPGFRPALTVTGIFGDPKARLVPLFRRSKKRFAAAAERLMSAGMTISPGEFVICPVAMPVSIWLLMFAVWPAGVAGR